MLVPLLLVAACAGAPPAEVELLLRADLDRAAEHLVQGDDPALAAAADRWLRLQPLRARVHTVELRLLETGVDHALILDDLPRATGLLADAMATMGSEPTLMALRERVEGALDQAPPADRAQAWVALAEVSRDPDCRARHLERADHAALEVRYSEAQRAATRASQVGITRAAAVDMLRRIDAEYYTRPDWEAATRAGARQLGWLVELGLASPVAPPPPHRKPAEALDAALAWGEQAGLEPETVIAEWMAGTLAALDGWTRAIWPAELASWQQEHAGVYYGVGLELAKAPQGGVRVQRPLLDTPAWTSGIHQDDRILRIDALSLADLEGDQLSAAEQALRGPAGSPVTLRLQRADHDPFEVTLTRAPVAVETVSGLQRRDDATWDPWLDEQDGLAYIHIGAFKPTTTAAFDALTQPVADRLRGVVMDLRGDPGGDIGAAMDIADRFVPDGRLIRVTGRVKPEPVAPKGAHPADWKEATPGHHLEGLAVVVLVDTETASAAELLAGALQDGAGAWLVGAPTWGKGRTQALRAEPGQSYAVQYTNLVWTLPGGQALDRDHGGGLQPDVQLAMSAAESYLARVLAHRRAAIRHHADGTPLRWEDLPRRYELPPLDPDPGILAGEIVLRAVIGEAG
ncbi:MAG: S41 family peptidase [Pseudomonadota bacterium]